MKIWIYRPDREAQARQINKDFLYNCRNKPYWDCFDEERERKGKIKEIREDIRHRVLKSKMEVPNE